MKKLWLICSLCCVCFSGFGQGTTPPPPLLSGSYLSGEEILDHIYSMDMNYHHIIQYAKIYQDSFPNDNHFAKRFGRWSDFWSPRVDASGYFDVTQQNMMNVLKDYPICGIGDDADWEQTGPIINTQNMGIIVTVASPQGQPNIIYAGSNTGGLWKTTNGGNSWTNMTDVLGVPGLGVNDILINPDNPNILYIATGFNYSFVPQNYGFGVLKSTNGGISWNDNGDTPLTWDPMAYSTKKEHKKLAFNKLAFHPDNPNLIYALSHFEVHRWLDDNLDYGSIIANSHEVLYIQPNDDGNPATDDYSKFVDIEFVKKTSTVNNYEYDTYVSTSGIWQHSGKLYRSPNDGDTWAEIAIENTQGHPPYGDINTCVIESALDDNANKTKLYVYYLYYYLATPTAQTGTPVAPLFEYDHYATGNKWTPLNYSVDNGDYYYRPEKEYTNFEVNPQNADIMYFPNKEIGKTIDRGNTITPLVNSNRNLSFVDSDIHAEHRDLMINFTGNSHKIIVGNDGGVAVGTPNINNMTTTNYAFQNINGTGSTSIKDRLVASQCTDISISNNISGISKVLLGGAVDNANYISNNNNFEWENIGNVDGGQTAINEAYGLAYIRVNNFFQIYNINTQSTVFSGLGTDPFPLIPSKEQYHDFTEIEIDRSNPNFFYIGKKKYFKKIEINSTNYTIQSTPVSLDFNTLFPGNSLDDASIYCFEQAYNNNDIMFLAFNGIHNQSLSRVFRRDPDPLIGWEALPPISINVADGNNTVAANPLWYRYITDISLNPNDDDEIWASISGWSQHGSSLRVIHSTDGGQNWEDLSEGLTSAPVNAIVYQEGSGGVLFAATDVGVYRFNPEISEWECFNQGFPVSLVNDLEISNCEQKIYASAYGRGIWESPLPPLERDYISSNTTWDTDSDVIATTVVESGERLTIENCTINMLGGTSIIVEPGGLLIVDNATVTSCHIWDGIVVKGDANASQNGGFTNNTQGKIILQNNARVEYAKDAIRLWDPIDGGGISKAGGIVRAENATFFNNRRDVEFMKYENFNPVTGIPARNFSYFTNCTFSLGQAYRVPDELDDRVTLWDVNGVQFSGCTFENTNTTLQQNHQRAAIYSIDAGYKIKSACNSSQPYANGCPANLVDSTLFDGFYYGVRATKGSGNYTITVDEATFDNNVTGIYSSGLDNVYITRCTFNIGNGTGGTYQHGVAFNLGTAYHIEENTFNGVGNLQNENLVGCLIQNFNPDNNEIYKNEFNDLNFGNAAVGNNRHPDENIATGLLYKCNTHTDNYNDIWVNYGAGIKKNTR